MRLSKEGYAIFAEIQKKAKENKRPISATFEITPRCGMNCRMCYVHLLPEQMQAYGKELSGKEWITLAQQAKDAGVLYLCVTGGDPLCHPDFKEFWKAICEMGFIITLQTPGNLIDEEMKELFRRYPPNEVKLTLYGSNDAVYKEVCRIENGFTKVHEGLERLKEIKVPVQLVTTFVKQNVKDADNIVRYAAKNGYRWYYSATCYPSLRNGNTDVSDCALSVYDLGCAEETGTLWKEKKYMKAGKKPCQYCSSYPAAYNITWNGDMRFCLFLNEPDIKALDNTFEENWQKLLLFWESISWHAKCSTCKIEKECFRCIAHLAVYNGGIGKITNQYCTNVEKMLEYKQFKGG